MATTLSARAGGTMTTGGRTGGAAPPPGPDAPEEGAPAPTAQDSPGEGDTAEHRDGPAAGPAPDNPRAAATIIIGVLVAIVAAGIGAIFFIGHRSGVSDADRDQEIMLVTRQVVGSLVTLRHQSADEDLKKITNATTGDFRKQFTDGGGSFATVLQQGAVESTGAAREVAIVTSDDSSATTIAAVTSTVKNSEVPDGQPRVYRMKLSLERHDGRWLVSNVEFVA